jgi:hypothetical protein
VSKGRAVGQNNPTFEYYPSRGAPIGLNILTTTLPANLYVLTWLLPSGRLFINSNLGNELFDYKNNVEYALPETPCVSASMLFADLSLRQTCRPNLPRLGRLRHDAPDARQQLDGDHLDVRRVEPAAGRLCSALQPTHG